jgi:glyoxylase-like metal-dependent hydrolase (beta-lactamase superfamily II)
VTSSTASDLYFVQEPVGEMANLAYAIGSRSTGEALLVDPAWDVERLLARAELDGMRVVGALATHYHQDHVGGSIFGMSIEGLPRLLELQPMPVHVQAREAEGLRRVTGLSSSDFALHEGGDEITLGSLRIRLLHTPGHTPGSISLVGAKLVFTGDTLFARGIGRTDFPGGSDRDMRFSLRKLLRLPDNYVVYPGHGATSVIGEEKRVNPFLQWL